MNVSEDIVQEVIADAAEICQIPAPTFSEQERGEYMAERFRLLGLQAEKSAAGNIYCQIGQGSAVVVAAHLDTVFPPETKIEIKQEGNKISAPGFADNSLGLAGLLFLAREFISYSGGRRSLLLACTVGEEGTGNLLGAKELLSEKDISEFIALEGVGIDDLIDGGPGSFRTWITVQGPGGHSWQNRHTPSAIEVLISILYHLQMSLSSDLAVNVGIIEGGGSSSAIASSARASIEIRSLDEEALALGKTQIEELAATEEKDITVSLQDIGSRPAGRVDTSSHLWQDLVRLRKAYGLQVDRGRAFSTDANAAYSQVPAIALGLTDGGNLHSQQEYADVGSLSQGLSLLRELLRQRL